MHREFKVVFNNLVLAECYYKRKKLNWKGLKLFRKCIAQFFHVKSVEKLLTTSDNMHIKKKVVFKITSTAISFETLY